jgi:hypothetical protein
MADGDYSFDHEDRDLAPIDYMVLAPWKGLRLAVFVVSLVYLLPIFGVSKLFGFEFSFDLKEREFWKWK